MLQVNGGGGTYLKVFSHPMLLWKSCLAGFIMVIEVRTALFGWGPQMALSRPGQPMRKSLDMKMTMRPIFGRNCGGGGDIIGLVAFCGRWLRGPAYNGV